MLSGNINQRANVLRRQRYKILCIWSIFHMNDVHIGKYDPQKQNAGGQDPRGHIFPLNKAYMTPFFLFII
jgi:hypothetical protein